MHVDLTQLVTESVTAYLRSEAGQKQVAEQVQRTTEAAVKAATGYGSVFAKTLEAAVLAALQVPQNFNLTSYNDYVAKVVTKVVHEGMSEAIAAQVEARLERLIPPIPDATSLSAITQMFADQCAAEKKAGDSSVDDRITIRLERDGGFTYLYLDKTEKKPNYQCQVQLGVYAGRIFHLRFGEQRIEQQMFVNPVFGVERYLFQLRASGTPVDADEVEDVSTWLVD